MSYINSENIAWYLYIKYTHFMKEFALKNRQYFNPEAMDWSSGNRFAHLVVCMLPSFCITFILCNIWRAFQAVAALPFLFDLQTEDSP